MDGGEKSLVYIIRVPVLQTDTGSQEENSKANGRRIVKELGKLTPYLPGAGRLRGRVQALN